MAGRKALWRFAVLTILALVLAVGLASCQSGGGSESSGWFFIWNNNSFSYVMVYLNGEKVWWEDGTDVLAPGEVLESHDSWGEGWYTWEVWDAAGRLSSGSLLVGPGSSNYFYTFP